MSPSQKPNRNQTVLGIYRILSIFCSELFKNCATPPGSHKETNNVAMGTKRDGSIPSSKKINV